MAPSGEDDVDRQDELHEVRERLANLLEHSFDDSALLRQALIHRSYAHENDEPVCNEPLEFLGDAVLGLLVAEEIVRQRSDLSEGDMTRLRASLVNTRRLAQEAGELGLGDYLLLGRGEDASGGRQKQSLLADGFEALIGAVYLDAGLEPVRRLILALFADVIATWALDDGGRDPKTRLQEWAQARDAGLPEYEIKESSGPDHNRRYVAVVKVHGRELGEGEGTSKKRAEQRAAKAALEKVRKGAENRKGLTREVLTETPGVESGSDT